MERMQYQIEAINIIVVKPAMITTQSWYERKASMIT